MPRLDADTWGTIRAAYEVGSSVSSLAKEYGVSRMAIQKRSDKEGWVQDPTEAVDRLVAAKVAGVVAPCNPLKKAEAIDNAASQIVAVRLRHRSEWDGVEEIRQMALAKKDFETAKLAKISAETLMIKQSGERKAWNLDVPKAADTTVNVSATASVVAEPLDPEAIAKASTRDSLPGFAVLAKLTGNVST